MKCLLIFPNQLYYAQLELQKYDQVVLFEDPLFFYDSVYKLKFHKLKLMLHRASMQAYWSEILHPKKTYVEWASGIKLQHLLSNLNEQGCHEIFTAEPVDYVLEKRLRRFTTKYQQSLTFLPNRLFLNTAEENQSYLLSHTKQKLNFTQFYIFQRKQLNVLLQNGKPIGGIWSFDAQNRKKLPKDLVLPLVWTEQKSLVITEAQKYVESNFPTHYGSSESFSYPVTRPFALLWLKQFVNDRLENFGQYEDAIDQQNHTLFHSVLSVTLNIGLILPRDILEEVQEHMQKNPDFSLNSMEGFLRQIIGWREFIRLVYDKFGTTQRKTNALQHYRKLGNEWYRGETGLEPVDLTIQSVLKTGYTHHIERLMILGTSMALCEIDPDQVYSWFMEMFIDSYDWVMVPNVYGMSQYADGGLMTTKPYVCSSNYLCKMSHYKKGPWSEIWDGLYWRFIDKHQVLLKKNLRMRFSMQILKQMDSQKKRKLMDDAENYLARYY